MDSQLNGVPATMIAVCQQPGATALQVSEAVRRTLEEMKPRFPDGLEYRISLDTTEFVRLSFGEVIHTLFEAILLVVLVVYLFLQNFRATVICSTAVVVALLGTFPFMLALGFSVNLLTLFGLVLAIGIVVDDAIVVVENVERTMTQRHLGVRDATIEAMGEVVSPVIATVLVMASIFVPAAFLPGTTGQLYKQFAITIAISVAISGFVALTLTPALCGVLLLHTTPPPAGPLRLVQPAVRRPDPRLRPEGGPVHPEDGDRLRLSRRVRGPHRRPLQGAAHELRAERGPGVRDDDPPAAGCGEPRPRRRGDGKG